MPIVTVHVHFELLSWMPRVKVCKPRHRPASKAYSASKGCASYWVVIYL